ncbi:unnamed protein product [Echinostoma caproni]|uniref:Uncharacterized protein n=1 Tax=Echinostoma caproni TaxID=27848 RepID=A0A183ACC9_9TREM|nr:unnamed protein product [Echinostoma caproni]
MEILALVEDMEVRRRRFLIDPEVLMKQTTSGQMLSYCIEIQQWLPSTDYMWDFYEIEGTISSRNVFFHLVDA